MRTKLAFTLPWLMLGGWLVTTSMVCAPPDASRLDIDGDGTPDHLDQFPADPTEQKDSDGDRVGDNADAFPDNPKEFVDTDGDGIGDNADDDDDGDGTPDAQDPTPKGPITADNANDNGNDTDNANDNSTDNANQNDNGSDGTPQNDNAGDGGNTNDNTADDPTPTLPDNPFAADPGQPHTLLTDDQRASYDAGRARFVQVFTGAEGLGPGARGNSCGGCHSIPFTGGYGLARLATVITPTGSTAAFRAPSSLYGVGLFELVSDEEILSRQDPADADGNGISGRANVEGLRPGRYGRKAQAATLESITRGMLQNQMGLTSDPLTETVGQAVPEKHWWTRFLDTIENVSFASHAYAQARPPSNNNGGGDSADGDSVADPEIDAETVEALMAYSAGLGAPVRVAIDEDIAAGEALFLEIGCGNCHTPALETLAGVMIYPYSDLLLHDLGETLADNLTIGSATGAEFRTQPLWGISRHTRFLHDGRSSSVENAILLHGGEAQASRDAFEALSESDRALVLAFLDSL